MIATERKETVRYLIVWCGGPRKVITQDRRRRHRVVTGSVALDGFLSHDPQKIAKIYNCNFIIRVKEKIK